MSKPVKIMIVEDEMLVAMHMELALLELGYELCGLVADGKDAVEMTKEQQPDVILMDIQLSNGIDGIEAAEQIRSFSQVPIIFTTGYPDSLLREKAEQIQPSRYMVKPVRVSDLNEVIEVLMTNP